LHRPEGSRRSNSVSDFDFFGLQHHNLAVSPHGNWVPRQFVFTQRFPNRAIGDRHDSFRTYARERFSLAAGNGSSLSG